MPKYSTVYTSPQTITLGKNELAGEATIGQWIGIEAATIDDVTATSNGWVQITAPVPGTEAVPGSTTYKYVLVKMALTPIPNI